MYQKIKLFILKNHTVVVLILFSLAVHLAASAFLFARFGDGVLYFENEDAHSYITIAQSLASGQGFSRNGMPSAVRTPGLPLVYALLMKLPWSFTWLVLIVQNLAATGTAMVVFYIGKKNFSTRVGTTAGFLTALEPYMIMTANLATTETLFNFVLVGTVYYFLKWFKNVTLTRALAFSSIGVGILILIRPVALYLPIVLIGAAVVRLYIEKVVIKKIFFSIAMLVLIPLIVVAPWSWRQWRVFGTPAVTNIDAYMMYYKISPLSVAAQTGVSYDNASKILDLRLKAEFRNFDPLLLTNTFLYNSFMKNAARQLIMANPAPVFKQYALSLAPTLTGTGYEYMLEDVFGVPRSAARVSYSGLFARHDWNSLFGAFRSFGVFQAILLGSILLWLIIYLIIARALFSADWWQAYRRPTIILGLFLAYFIFFGLGPASHARYRTPTFPFWFLLVAASLDFLRHQRIIKNAPRQ